MVGAGVFTVGYGRSRWRSLLLGGLGTGLGVAAMHYLTSAYVALSPTARETAVGDDATTSALLDDATAAALLDDVTAPALLDDSAAPGRLTQAESG
jgi:hypothetical protein